MLTFKLEAANVNFQQFWTFLTIFKILCCLTVFVVFEQVLNVLGRFFTTLIKNQFFLKKVFVMVFGHENHFQAVFSTVQQILTFLTAF